MSIGYRIINSDGTRNIHCIQCVRFISTASPMTGITTALCVICQADRDGIDLTPEQVRDLVAVRHNGDMIAESAAYPEQVPDPMGHQPTQDDDETNLTVNRLGYFVKALVYSIRETIAERIKPVPVSKQIAKAKKRRRVFDLEIELEGQENKTDE